MGLLIKGSPIPQNCHQCDSWGLSDVVTIDCPVNKDGSLYSFTDRPKGCPLNHVPEHGRLIDADALRAKMYHEAFETDTPMQKWDSGCWIRYKMFERMEESAPTIIPADPVEVDNG